MRNVCSWVRNVCWVVTVSVLGAAAARAGLDPAPPTPALSSTPEALRWSQRMLELSQTLAILLPDIISNSRFNDPNNAARIDEAAVHLAQLAHTVATPERSAVPSPDADPSLRFMASLFANDIQQAVTALAQGQRAYARMLLRDVTGHCIGCHTRSARNTRVPVINIAPEISRLPSLEQADIYLAVHQFDQAMNVLQGVLADRDAARTRPLDYHRAGLRALAVAVRVHNDPAQAEAIVNQMARTLTAPLYVRDDAVRWRDSIAVWRRDEARSRKERPLAAAERLLADAPARMRYPRDHAQDVLLLRASALLHNYLRDAPTGPTASQGLYIAGQCYELLTEIGVAPMHEYYYEACVRTAPHTQVARNCYLRFEESVFDGYTGSGGSHIPPDVAVQLSELEKLSTPRPGDM